MSQYKSQIQNHFLSSARKKHLPVEVILNTGTSLRGKIKGYDQFSISLSFKEKVEVIYKSSILIVSLLARKNFPRREGDFGDRPVRPPRRYSDAVPENRPTEPVIAPPPVAPPKPKPASMIIDDDFLNDPPPPRKTPTKPRP